MSRSFEGIDDEEYDTAFTPINNDHIVDIFLDADVYISYWKNQKQ